MFLQVVKDVVTQDADIGKVAQVDNGRMIFDYGSIVFLNVSDSAVQKIFQAVNLGKPLQHPIIAELDTAHIDMDRTLYAATS
jgi:uncharacterized Rmd1/YagE family protein